MAKNDRYLLKQIYRNAKDNSYLLELMLPKVENKKLYKELSLQKEYYEQTARQSKCFLQNEGAGQVFMPIRQRMQSYLKVQAETATNLSTHHLVKVMMTEYLEGAADLRGALKRRKNADAYTVEFATELIRFEEEQIQNMKQFL